MDHTFTALTNFISMAKDKGLYNINTAGGYASVVGKIFGDLPDHEKSDVRNVSVDDSIRRFNNKQPGTLSPGTMREYSKRLTRVVKDFAEYQTNPITFGAKSSSVRVANSSVNSKKEADAKKKPTTIKVQSKNDLETSAELVISPSQVVQRIVMSFPLRSDFNAELGLPRDLKLTEAKRLSAFLKTLCSDFDEA